MIRLLARHCPEITFTGQDMTQYGKMLDVTDNSVRS